MIDAARASVGLRRLAVGLVAYGVIGLIVAAVGLAALIRTSDRIGDLSSGVSNEVERLGRILDRTATALDEASDTAASFGNTIDRTGPTVSQAATAVRDIVPRLRDLEAQANGISIFGSRPLAPLASLFGEIATELDGLDTQLDGIAEELGANRAVLTTNAESLNDLATEIRTLANRLPTTTGDEPLLDLQGPVVVAMALLVVWAGVPAAGALALGMWLRRLLEPDAQKPAPGPAGD